jgi:hypothetical protein
VDFETPIKRATWPWVTFELADSTSALRRNRGGRVRDRSGNAPATASSKARVTGIPKAAAHSLSVRRDANKARSRANSSSFAGLATASSYRAGRRASLCGHLPRRTLHYVSQRFQALRLLRLIGALFLAAPIADSTAAGAGSPLGARGAEADLWLGVAWASA